MTIEDIAKICHEANRAYCQAIGDDSQVAWEDAPDWQRQSIINGVQFAVNMPDVEPGMSHENWLREKRNEGWKYGPVKDPEKKEHPCYMPFGELPMNERYKDRLFVGIVRALRQAIPVTNQ